MLDWDFARPGDPIEDLAWAAWLWTPLMAGYWWHAEYGLEDENVQLHQQLKLAALVDGYGPSTCQRETLADAILEQMIRHAADLEEMARSEPAFAELVERGVARSARDDAAWWTAVPPGSPSPRALRTQDGRKSLGSFDD